MEVDGGWTFEKVIDDEHFVMLLLLSFLCVVEQCEKPDWEEK